MLAMLHPAFHLDAQAGSAGCLRIVALLFEPVEDFGAPVTDASTDTEAGWAGPEVAPVAQRGHGDADHAGDLLHGEQLVVGVRGVGRFGRLGDAHVGSPQRSAGSLTFRQWSFVLRRDQQLISVANPEKERSPDSYPPRDATEEVRRGYVGVCAGQTTSP